MKRKLLRQFLVLAALLLVFVVFWPVYVGARVEDRFLSMQAMAFDGGTIEYLPGTYSRTWYSGHGQGVIRYRSGGQTLIWPVQHSVRHRVLGVDVETVSRDASRPEGSDPRLLRLIEQGAPRLRSFVGINRGFTVRLDLRKISNLTLPVTGPPGLPEVSVSLGELRGGLAVREDRWVLSLDSDFLSLNEAPGQHWWIEQPRLRLALQPVDPMRAPVLGKPVLEIDYDLTVGIEALRPPARAKAKLPEFDGVTVSASQSGGPEALNVLAQIDIAELRLPDHGLSPVESELRIFRLNYRAMSELVGALDRSDRQSPPIESLGRDPRVILEDVLALDPEIRLNLSIDADPTRQLAGELSLETVPVSDSGGGSNSHSGFGPETDPESGSPAEVSPLDRLLLEGSLYLGPAWWQSPGLSLPGVDPKRVQQWVEQGLMREWLVATDTAGGSGSAVTGRLSLRDGQLKINDRDASWLRVLLLLLDRDAS